MDLKEKHWWCHLMGFWCPGLRSVTSRPWQFAGAPTRRAGSTPRSATSRGRILTKFCIKQQNEWSRGLHSCITLGQCDLIWINSFSSSNNLKTSKVMLEKILLSGCWLLIGWPLTRFLLCLFTVNPSFQINEGQKYVKLHLVWNV